MNFRGKYLDRQFRIRRWLERRREKIGSEQTQEKYIIVYRRILTLGNADEFVNQHQFKRSTRVLFSYFSYINLKNKKLDSMKSQIKIEFLIFSFRSLHENRCYTSCSDNHRLYATFSVTTCRTIDACFDETMQAITVKLLPGKMHFNVAT